MPKYRKKPVVIEAIQFQDDAEVISKISDFAEEEIRVDYSVKPPVLKINTLEGTMTANVGDYIIKGVQGEFYPCKPDIFLKSYEPFKDSSFNISVSVKDTDLFKDLLSVVELAVNGASQEESRLRLENILSHINS